MAITPKTRNRGSVRLSHEGKSLLRERLKQKGCSQEKWAELAFVSISTIQRLLKREKVDRGSFDAVFKPLGLNPDNFIAPRDDQQDSTAPSISSPILQPPDQSHTEHSGSPQRFMITGTFTPNKLAEIEGALVHLEKLLQANATFTLVPENNCLAVSGTFSENKKPEIEVALMHLEKLLLEHTTTFN